jgi:hypothetical protein
MANPQVEILKKQLAYANKRVSFAWAKYYEEVNQHFEIATVEYKELEVIVNNEIIPEHIKSKLKTMTEELKKKWDCCVCLDFITDIEITNCGHFMCKDCLEGLKQHTEGDSWSCPVCRKKSKK